MYQTGTASGYKDLLNRLNAFLTGTGSAWGVKRFGAGSGRLASIAGGPNSVVETITLVAESAGSFSVNGSASGRIGTATLDTPFISDKLSFTVRAGNVPFSAGDTFTFSTAPKWVAKRAVVDDEYIWQAPGTDGTTAVYVGAKAYAAPSSDIYNIQLQGFTGFDSGASFPGQPGAIAEGYGQGLGLWLGDIPYWFVANGRRVIVVAKVSSVYQAGYLGLIEQYIDPLVYPYALAVGGTVLGNRRYSDPSEWNRCFPLSGSPTANASQLTLRLPTGAWRNLAAAGATGAPSASSDGGIWPYQSGLIGLRPGLDGSAPLLPVTLFDGNPKQIYGRLEGICATTGFGTGAESLIDDGPDTHLVMSNVFRTAPDQFFTVKLD